MVNGGAQPIVGYNYGARKYERVMQVLKYALLGATAIAVFGFIITRIYSVQLITLFNRQDAELIAFGSRALLVYTLAMPIIGLQMVGAGFFQAIGKPLHSMLLSLSRQVLVFIPCLLILPRFFGLDGILFAGPVADTVSTIITLTWLIMEVSNLRRRHQDSLGPGDAPNDAGQDSSQVMESVYTLKP